MEKILIFSLKYGQKNKKMAKSRLAGIGNRHYSFNGYLDNRAVILIK